MESCSLPRVHRIPGDAHVLDPVHREIYCRGSSAIVWSPRLVGLVQPAERRTLCQRPSWSRAPHCAVDFVRGEYCTERWGGSGLLDPERVLVVLNTFSKSVKLQFWCALVIALILHLPQLRVLTTSLIGNKLVTSSGTATYTSMPQAPFALHRLTD